MDLVAVDIVFVRQVGHNLLHLLGKGYRAEEQDRCQPVGKVDRPAPCTGYRARCSRIYEAAMHITGIFWAPVKSL